MIGADGWRKAWRIGVALGVGMALAACGGGDGGSGAKAGADGPDVQVAAAKKKTPPGQSGGTTTPSNTAPTISGTPTTALTAGTAWSFQPVARDAEQQVLGFTITNKPAWATFSTSTGLLSGTPGAGDVGTFAGIVISVSDGSATAALAPFDLTVAAPPVAVTRTATLTWQAPTVNSDGTPLTNLAGYRVRYGSSADALTNVVELANPGLTAHVVPDLAAGTWYFGIAAYNTDGAEGALSAVASKTLL